MPNTIDFGAFTPYLTSDEILQAVKSMPDVELFAIHPGSGRTGENRSISGKPSARLLEFRRQLDSEGIEVYGGSNPGDTQSYISELQQCYPGTRTEPRTDHTIRALSSSAEASKLEASGVRIVYFRVYLNHGLEFVSYDLGQPRVSQKLVDLLRRTRGGQVQLEWRAWDWSRFAERSSNLLASIASTIDSGKKFASSPLQGFIKGAIWGVATNSMPPQVTGPHPWAGSYYHTQGWAIAQEYASKSHATPLVVSIAGVLLIDEDVDITSYFSGIRVTLDDLVAFRYDDSRFIWWLRKAITPDPTPMMEQHNAFHEYIFRLVSKGERWPYPQDPNGWNHGRPLIPVLAVTPAELAIFVNLPPSLTVSKAVEVGPSTRIIVDGSNVAWNGGSRTKGDRPKAQNIQLVVQELRELGCEDIAVFCDASLEYDVEDKPVLEKLYSSNFVHKVPANTDADEFIINYAKKTDARIVTNDTYSRDWAQSDQWVNDHKEEFRIPFMIIGDKVVLSNLRRLAPTKSVAPPSTTASTGGSG